MSAQPLEDFPGTVRMVGHAGGKQIRTKAEKLVIAQSVWQMSADQHSYTTIASTLGLPLSSVAGYLDMWAKQLGRADAATLRHQMNEVLLETLGEMRSVQKVGKDRDRIEAANVVIRTVQTFSKMNGLDSPIVVEQNMHLTVQDRRSLHEELVELKQLTDQLAIADTSAEAIEAELVEAELVEVDEDAELEDQEHDDPQHVDGAVDGPAERDVRPDPARADPSSFEVMF